MARPARRPPPRSAGDFHARVVRGPKDNRHYYRIWRTEGGVEVTILCGWFTDAEVQQKLSELVVFGAQSPQVQNSVRVVRDLAELWLASQEDRVAAMRLRKTTLHARKAALRHVVRVLGDVPVNRLDVDRVEKYQSQRFSEQVPQTQKRNGAAPAGESNILRPGRTPAVSSVTLEMQVMRMAWRWGHDRGLVPQRELPVVRTTGYAPARSRFTPTTAQVQLVLAELDGWARVAFVLYASTGCRLDEIASLTWGQVNLDDGILWVVGKRGRRQVVVAEEVVAELRALGPRASTERVLTCAYSTARAVDAPMKAACRRAGVPSFGAGALRRYVVRELYRNATDVSVAGEVMGHSAVVALRHYREVDLEEKRAAVKQAGLGSSLLQKAHVSKEDP